MSDVWSRRGYQRQPSDTLQRLESPKEQMWQVFPGVLRMIWGRRKRVVGFTLQSEMTEKQYEKMLARLLEIAERHDMGFGHWVDGGVLVEE
jgi:hypothetical protein